MAARHRSERGHRLAYVALTLLLTFALGRVYRESLLDLFRSPLGEVHLSYLSPLEPLESALSRARRRSLRVCGPRLWLQLLLFRLPALAPGEGKLLRRTGALSLAFYGLLLVAAKEERRPRTWHYLCSLSVLDPEDPFHFRRRTGTQLYLSWLRGLRFGRVLLSQLPPLLYLARRLRWIEVTSLRAWRRWGILASLATAALRSPPDPLLQALLSLPLLLSYELLALYGCYRHRRRLHGGRGEKG